VLALLPAFTTFVIIPFGPDLTVGGRTIPLVVAPVDTGVLLFLALSSLAVYSLVLAGYASNNKFSLIGGIRASAQLISYELALTLSVLAVLLPVNSFRLSDIVAYQQAHVWNFIPQILGFFVFLVALVRGDQPAAVRPAESGVGAHRRLPYRVQRHAVRGLLPGRVHQHGGARGPRRGRSSSAAGACRACTSAAGSGPSWASPPWSQRSASAWGVFVWVRWTFPALSATTSVMRLGWKVLLPLSILNLILVAAMTLGGLALISSNYCYGNPHLPDLRGPGRGLLAGGRDAPEPVYATMSLVVTLFSVAVLFVLLGAPFLGALQILIYAGAIVVLFLFVIMLLNLQKEGEAAGRRRGQLWVAPAGCADLHRHGGARLLARGRAGPSAADRGPGLAQRAGYGALYRLPAAVRDCRLLLLVAVIGATVAARRGARLGGLARACFHGRTSWPKRPRARRPVREQRSRFLVPDAGGAAVRHRHRRRA